MIRELLRKFWPFVKYCFVGALGTFIDLASLYIFVEYVKIPVIPASVLSFLLAVVNNFVLNKTWTFKSKSRNYRKLFIKFLIVSTVGLGLTVALMYAFVNGLGIWYMLAKAMTSLIVLTWNFLGNKLWTFNSISKGIFSQRDSSLELSVVIPAYNEERRIKSTLLLIDEYLINKNINAEIIVVSDGSSDKTVDTVKKFIGKIKNLKIESYEKNRGKGYAVRKGVEASRGEHILFTDADNSTPIEEYERLKKAFTDHDVAIAIGSRYLPSSDVQIKQPFYRRALGRVGNVLIRMFLIDGLRDTQCGFKLFNGSVAKEIFSMQKVTRFGFDMEALVIANSLGYKIKEVPVSWFNSAESRVRPIKDALVTLKDLVYIKLNLWSGRYFSEK